MFDSNNVLALMILSFRYLSKDNFESREDLECFCSVQGVPYYRPIHPAGDFSI